MYLQADNSISISEVQIYRPRSIIITITLTTSLIYTSSTFNTYRQARKKHIHLTGKTKKWEKS